MEEGGAAFASTDQGVAVAEQQYGATEQDHPDQAVATAEVQQEQYSALVGQKRGWDEGGDAPVPDSGVVPESHADDANKPTPPWPGHPGENVYRLLIPVRKVGAIIGKKGVWVKAVCEETKARVKILEGVNPQEERVVLISAREDYSLSVPPAIQALLKVHNRVVEGGDEMENEDGTRKAPPVGPVTCRLLVAATQAGSVIGRQGATVKGLKEESGATIRVLPPEEVPMCGMPDDRVVEITGGVPHVLRALELVANHLRRFLHDRSVLQIFEHARPFAQRPPMNSPPMMNQLPMAMEPDRYMNGGGMGRVPAPSPTYAGQAPARADQYYQQQRQPTAASQAEQQALVTPAVASIGQQVIQRMTVPVSYADSIIGAGGAHIAYIRRTSGASVTVHTTDGAEMAVEMRGSAAQVQSAQQLVQDFMAGAVVPSATETYSTQAQAQAYPTTQAYSTQQDTGYAGSTAASAYGGAQTASYGTATGQTGTYDQSGTAYGGATSPYGTTAAYDRTGNQASYTQQGAGYANYSGSY